MALNSLLSAYVSLSNYSLTRFWKIEHDGLCDW